MEKQRKQAEKRIDSEQVVSYSSEERKSSKQYNAGKDYKLPYQLEWRALRDIISAANLETVKTLPVRYEAIDPEKNVKYEEKDKEAVISFIGSETIKIAVGNLDIFNQDGNKSKKPSVDKMMFYIIMNAAGQYLPAANDRKAKVIELPLTSFVEDGVYKNVRSVRNAITERNVSSKGVAWNVADQLQSYKLCFESETGRFESHVLFPDVTIEYNKCCVTLNRNIDWYKLCKYCCICNSMWFELSNKAFDLVLYVLMLVGNKLSTEGRKKTGIKGEYTFSVRLKRLQLIGATLRDKEIDKAQGVPIPHNPGESIEKRLFEIVSEINQLSMKENLGITLYLQDREENQSIWEWLDKGICKITVSGEYRRKFKSIAESGKGAISNG